jgi:predicted CopG family antitoxin
VRRKRCTKPISHPTKGKRVMKTIQISDELFDELKSLVVDPFDDTPDSVIGRVIQIVKKAKSRWSPLDACSTPDEPQVQVKPSKHEAKQYSEEDADQVVLL